MSQPKDFRRRWRRTSGDPIGRSRLALATVASFLAIAASALGASALHYWPDGEPADVGSEVDLNFNPSHVVPATETPDSLALFLPQGFKFDKTAVTKECTPAQAAAVSCPRAARIGFGYVNVHVSGYLLPGGATNAVVYLTAFLAPPTQAGDLASIVLEAEWLGVDPAFQALHKYFPVTIRTRTSEVGRLFRVSKPPYGLEISFANLPGGLRVPPPASTAGLAAAITRFKIQISAIRRTRKTIVHRMTVQGLHGPQVFKIKDHILVPHHLFARPKACPSSRQWPWQIEVGFPDGVQTVSGQVSCHP